MKKQLLTGTLVLLITFGLASCGSTPTKDDKAACNTILNEATDFATAHSKELKNIESPAKLFKLVKPLESTLNKAAEQAKTKELNESLTKISAMLKKDSIDIAEFSERESDFKTIDSTCKAAGVDIMAKLRKL